MTDLFTSSPAAPVRPSALARWLGQGAWTVLDQGLFAGTNFLLNVLLARWLAPDAYGSFTLVSFAALLLVGVVHTGLLTEPMLVYGPGPFRAQRRAYVRLVLGGHRLFALVAGGVLVSVAGAAFVLGSPVLGWDFAALAVAQGAILLMWLLRRACYVYLRPQVAMQGGLLYVGVMGVGLVGLQALGLLSGATAIGLMGAASLAAAATIGLRLGLYGPSAPAPALEAEARRAHRLYGGWATATGGLEWVQGVLPFLILPIWHGLEATGAFRALFNLVMPVMQAYGALSLLLVPAFVAARRSGRLRQRAGQALGAVLAGTALYAVAVALVGDWLLVRLYGPTYAGYHSLLWLFALYPVVGGSATVLGAVRRAQERPRRLFKARAGAAAVMATAGTLLIHAFGLFGAILADVAAAVAEVVGLALPSRKAVPEAEVTAGPSKTAGGDGQGGRLRVLLSAYACIPGAGSEPAVGWGTAREMARHHDVWVLTYAGFRRAIEAELAERPVPGLRFVYYKLPFERARHAVEGTFRTGLAEQAHYYLWQLAAARVVRRLHRQVRFDLAHHVTFVKYWAPCALAWAPIPFIWGPVGGGESAPRPFYAWLSPSGLRYERQRDAAQAVAARDPLVRRAARRAALTFATTEETRARIRRMGGQRVEVRSAIGLPADEIARLGALPDPPAGVPLRFFSLGRLIAFKGYRFGLMAFGEAVRAAEAEGDRALDGAEYWLVGDGPERAVLEALAAELGLADRVRFTGNLPRAEALAALGGAHVLVHPSLHESGGLAALEAMAARRPVVGLALGGTAVHVPPEAGLLVPAEGPEATVQALAHAMRRLAADAALRQGMGEAGAHHVATHFGWEKRVAEMAARYWDVAAPARRSRSAYPSLPVLVVPEPSPVTA